MQYDMCHVMQLQSRQERSKYVAALLLILSLQHRQLMFSTDILDLPSVNIHTTW